MWKMWCYAIPVHPLHSDPSSTSVSPLHADYSLLAVHPLHSNSPNGQELFSLYSWILF